jgi:hypothetical protein
MRVLLQSTDESLCARQRHVEIIDAEEQEESIARLGVPGTRQ